MTSHRVTARNPRWRQWIERLSRGVVLQRRLPAELGSHRIYVSPDARLRFWLPDVYRSDRLLLRLGRELVRSGDAVWDIGANVGLFSFAAAHFAGSPGEVVALEPDPWLAGLIRRSGHGFPSTFASIEVIEAAASAVPGPLVFAIARRGRATSHLSAVDGSTQSGGSRSTMTVRGVTLDMLLDDHRPPRLVKIDVEGAELLCLQGARALLSSVRPAILCEVDAANRPAVGDILAAADYQLFDAEQAPTRRERLLQPVWNTLAIPISR